MKEINEKFFQQKTTSRTIDDHIQQNEKVLWRCCPKKFSYALNQSIKLMPIALLWAAIDFGLLFGVILQQEIGPMLFIIIPFFALHLMPFWIWIGQTVKASRHLKGVKYVITNQRVFEFQNDYGYISTCAEIKHLVNVELKRSFIDKILGVGDIYITSKTGSFAMFDIPKSDFVFGKLKEICDNRRAAQEGFYAEHNECAHCGSYYMKSAKKCPNCGAPSNKK